jgi:hypothetical protein
MNNAQCRMDWAARAENPGRTAQKMLQFFQKLLDMVGIASNMQELEY